VGVANPSLAEAYFDLLGVEQDPPLVAEEHHRRTILAIPVVPFPALIFVFLLADEIQLYEMVLQFVLSTNLL
jgi:hypothetical protein